jgi:hypothetical protein
MTAGTISGADHCFNPFPVMQKRTGAAAFRSVTLKATYIFFGMHGVCPVFVYGGVILFVAVDAVQTDL